MKIKIIAALMVAIVAFSGCSKSKEVAEETVVKIERTGDNVADGKKMIESLKDYRATASVEYISNKGSHKYDTLQHGKVTGEYRIEVTGPKEIAGTITVNDGEKIYQYNPAIEGQLSVDSVEKMERSELFFSSFVHNFINNNGKSETGENDTTVFEAKINGNHPYLTSEKLWVDNATLVPKKMVIYDKEGNETIVITYITFGYNVELDENLFKIQAN